MSSGNHLLTNSTIPLEPFRYARHLDEAQNGRIARPIGSLRLSKRFSCSLYQHPIVARTRTTTCFGKNFSELLSPSSSWHRTSRLDRGAPLKSRRIASTRLVESGEGRVARACFYSTHDSAAQIYRRDIDTRATPLHFSYRRIVYRFEGSFLPRPARPTNLSFFLALARSFRFPFRFSELGNVRGRGYWRGKKRNGAKYTVFQQNRRIHFSRFRASKLYRQDGGATDNDRRSSNLLSSFFLSFLPSFLPFLYLSSPSLLLSSPSSPAISSVHPRTRTFHRQDPAFIVA